MEPEYLDRKLVESAVTLGTDAAFTALGVGKYPVVVHDFRGTDDRLNGLMFAVDLGNPNLTPQLRALIEDFVGMLQQASSPHEKSELN